MAVGEDYDIPAVCEAWLADQDRVAWLRRQLADHPEYEVTATQVGQIFCNVIYAWGRDLAARGVAPQSVMCDADMTSWEAAMRAYPWGNPVV